MAYVLENMKKFTDLPGYMITRFIAWMLSSPEDSVQKREKIARTSQKIGETLNIFICPLIFVLFLNATALQAYHVPSGSMIPTLEIHDRLFGNKLAYVTGFIRRGDIVIFKSPVDEQNWVKRVIGMPGDEVFITNGQVFINGQVLNEPYLNEFMFGNMKETTVPEGHYFVLGDNRNHSNDSRIWGFLERKRIIGKALLRYWPLHRMSMLNHIHEYGGHNE